MVRGGSRISARAIWATGSRLESQIEGREAAKADGHHLGLREVDLRVCRELHGALQGRSVQDPVEVAGASCIELTGGLEIEAAERTRQLLRRRAGANRISVQARVAQILTLRPFPHLHLFALVNLPFGRYRILDLLRLGSCSVTRLLYVDVDTRRRPSAARQTALKISSAACLERRRRFLWLFLRPEGGGGTRVQRRPDEVISRAGPCQSRHEVSTR